MRGDFNTVNQAQEIKERLDIVAVISNYVSLQKSGKNFRALCPFHPEKTPSFYVFPEKQSWYCFGRCQTGGDVFAFLMKKENIGFGEALQALAAQAGVTLATPARDEGAHQEREQLYQLNEAAASFYHQRLLSSAGEEAQGYLARRGLSPASVADFELGYSPSYSQALRQHLQTLGHTVEAMAKAGLLTSGTSGEYHDLFRHRLMFPIRSAIGGQGRVVGFGGRTLENAVPKYLNSPATPIFDKKSLLYGLNRARDAIRRQDQAILVEGYFDVIALHQSGFANAVATMGVALTEAQLTSLKRLTRSFILSLDADAAGLEATIRGVEVAAQTLGDKVVPIPTWQGMIRYEHLLNAEIKVLALPPGQDPDEVVLSDPGKWAQLLTQAQPVMDFLLAALGRGIDLTHWEEKAALVNRLKPLYNEIKDPIRWSHYLQKLSRQLNVEEKLLVEALRTPPRAARPGGGGARLPTRAALEEQCLALLFNFPELRESGQSLSPDLLEETANRELLRRWQEDDSLPSRPQELEMVLREQLERVKQRAVPIISPREREKAFESTVLRLREKHLRFLLSAQQEALSQSAGETPAHLEELGTELNTQLRQVFQERQNLNRHGGQARLGGLG